MALVIGLVAKVGYTAISCEMYVGTLNDVLYGPFIENYININRRLSKQIMMLELLVIFNHKTNYYVATKLQQ